MSLVSEKKAYTPAEFAALFGREKTWTYRMLYKGKINGISDYGRMMIPASEAARIENEGKRYLGRKRKEKADKKSPAKGGEEGSSKPPTGAVDWQDWVKAKKRNGVKKPAAPKVWKAKMPRIPGGQGG